MALQPVSHLFLEGAHDPTHSDMGYMVENFLRNKLKSDAISCRLQERRGNVQLHVRTGNVALAEAALIRERDVRDFLAETFSVVLHSIRVVV